jgi:TATA-box binding protein (TBP) (component of TFIID and TFIIIB)
MSISHTSTIDSEWAKFILSGYKDDDDSEDEEIDNIVANDFISADINSDLNSEAPKSTNIYISTKTKIAYLNMHIDLKEIFWKVPIIPYSQPTNGVIKKQMKFNSTEHEDLNFIQKKLEKEKYFEEHIITHIDNPSGRIKFKDIRKISIGISKKDIMSYRCKKKSAFYNCFVLILRLKIDALFKEFHVKVFNTGKLEIPGIQSEDSFKLILKQVLEILQSHIEDKIEFRSNTDETVLINSNFNCGYFINREALYDILKNKYNLQAIYDPCSYPGIQCKFYFNPDIGIQSGSQISEENKALFINIKEVSFMIFRTGSVLIVGKCDEDILMQIYEFLKIILFNEFKNICQKNINNQPDQVVIANKDKKKKIRRKNIIIELIK